MSQGSEKALVDMDASKEVMFGACAATASRTPFVYCVRDRQRLLSLGQNKEGAYGVFESALIVKLSSPSAER